MAITVNVNGVAISYPQTGDPNWGDNATNFAIQVASVLAKIGQSGAPVNDNIIVNPGNLSVTSGNLTVGGNSTLTGNLTVNGNTLLGNANTDTIGITGIVNIDSGTLYVDPVNNRVGINDTTPSEAFDVTGNVAITGNETVGGTLIVTGNTTVDGIIYADDNTTANTPVISFIGDTNTGFGRSGADTLDFITDGNSRFRIESTGQIKAVYESTLGTDYNTTLHNGYLCRAWVNFDGTSSNLTGTYSRTGTTITVSITSHGLTTGQSVYLDFTTGTGTDGIYIVTVVNANSYTVTDTVSGSTSGNVTQFRYIRASGNVSSITDNGTGDYTVNFTTAMPDANYSLVGFADRGIGSGSFTILMGTNNATYSNTFTASSSRITTRRGYDDAIFDSLIVSIAIFR